MTRRAGIRMQRRNGGGGLAFTPKTLPGILAWYRADLGVTIGTGVSAWADQSGAGNTAVQAVGVNQPTLTASNAAFNGKPTIASTATQWLTAPVATPNPMTIWVVGTWAASSVMVSAQALAWYFADNGANVGLSSAAAYAVGPRAISGAATVVAIDGTNGQVWTSQHSGGAVVSTGANAGTSIWMLNSSAQTQGGDVMAEMAIWNRALSPGEIDQLNRYAGSRYSIGIGA